MITKIKDLEQPSAERIKQLETFSTELDMAKFKNEYGHSNDFCLDKVLWWCSNMFSTM